MPLVECVPNVSEGRDAGRVRELAAILEGRDDVHLLDVHQDPYHHRSVFTIVGAPDPVSTAVFEFACACIDRVDLRHHRGEHPRMGAIDVIPFVPLHDLSVPAAVAVARSLGRRIADQTGVPVFFYGDAAHAEGRRRLAAIRGSGFEALSDRMALDHHPDVGPPHPHPTAGATAVGVRDFLVAFNVLLDTAAVEVAREIARRVRTTGGGRAGIQALGFSVAGRAQVSMNLYDLARTTIVDAFDDVAAEARALDVGIVASEIVGLAPTASLPDTADRIALRDDVGSCALEPRVAEWYPRVRLRR